MGCELELGSDDDGLKDYLSEVSDSPLWVSIPDFLTPPDILVMCTAGPKWNHAIFLGPFAALCFFLLEKAESERGESEPLALGEWT